MKKVKLKGKVEKLLFSEKKKKKKRGREKIKLIAAESNFWHLRHMISLFTSRMRGG